MEVSEAEGPDEEEEIFRLLDAHPSVAERWLKSRPMRSRGRNSLTTELFHSWVSGGAVRDRRPSPCSRISSDGIEEEDELFVELLRDISTELDMDRLCHKIMVNITRLTQAELGSLYLAKGSRKAGRHLVRKLSSVHEESEFTEAVSPGGDDIVEFHTGIVGYVAQTRETVNLTHASQSSNERSESRGEEEWKEAEVIEDPRFDPTVDQPHGTSHIESLLCMPLINHNGEVIGVALIVNSANGEFSLEDQKFKGIGGRKATSSMTSLWASRFSAILKDVPCRRSLGSRVEEEDQRCQPSSASAAPLQQHVRPGDAATLETASAGREAEFPPLLPRHTRVTEDKRISTGSGQPSHPSSASVNECPQGRVLTVRDCGVFRKYMTFCGIGIQNAELFELSVHEFRKNQAGKNRFEVCRLSEPCALFARRLSSVRAVCVVRPSSVVCPSHVRCSPVVCRLSEPCALFARRLSSVRAVCVVRSVEVGEGNASVVLAASCLVSSRKVHTVHTGVLGDTAAS
ncbi:unnamed protein product [Cyprideis torosa]|uniref:Uncharacterized protein n=1 Tax=Cyprideis torosa TaxID=163714 RepID=A0A7R8WHT5_9CRUS|nr:unnamed protein product [Cyprideis torosa]CAG0893322.1 unnamed protein product [Cyprideis torosa]